MAVVGTKVTAANYNTIQGKIQSVLGIGDGAQVGYGRTLASSAKSSGDVIAAQDMQNLYTDLITARTHQTNPVTWTNADGLAAPVANENVGTSAADVGNETPLTIFSLVASTEYMIVDVGNSNFTLIGASANEAGIKFTATGPGSGTGIAKLSPTSVNAEEDLAEGYLDFEAAATEIVTDVALSDPTNFSVTTKLTDTRTSQWGGGDYATPGTKITHEAEVTWPTADDRRYYFNTGGVITFDADMIGAVTANSKNDNWNTILANMGTITFGNSATSSDGSSPGTGSAIGNYYASWGLTSVSNQVTLFTKNGSGLYADIKYQITAWEEAAGNASTPSTLRFRIELQDNDFRTGGQYSSIDEYVTNDITSNVSVRHDTILNIPSPSFTTITSLNGGAATQTSASLTRNPTGQTINEGDDVTFTLQVSPVANGALIGYTLSGAGITVGDFDNSQGMGGQFTMNAGQGSVTITAREDTFTEGTETLTLTVPDFGISSSIIINDSSTTPTGQPPPPTTTYDLVGPATIDEGTNNTYYISTTNFTGTLYWTINATTNDFTAISGSVAITSNSGSFTLSTIADTSTEGNETYLINLRTGSISGLEVDTLGITVNDTSLDPVSTYTGDTPVVPNISVSAFSYQFNGAPTYANGYYKFHNDFSITKLSSNQTTIVGDWLPDRAQGEVGGDYEIFVTAGTPTVYSTYGSTPVITRAGASTGTWLPISSSLAGFNITSYTATTGNQVVNITDTVQIRKILEPSKTDSGSVFFAAMHNDLGGLICLTNEMIVQEYNKGFVRVYDIEIGDLILGSDGYTEVLDTIKDHPREGYWVLDGWLEITNDHPVLTDAGWIRAEDYTGNKEYKQVLTDTVYIETADEAIKIFDASTNISMLVSGQYKEQS
jgi:hypothetical protein